MYLSPCVYVFVCLCASMLVVVLVFVNLCGCVCFCGRVFACYYVCCVWSFVCAHFAGLLAACLLAYTCLLCVHACGSGSFFFRVVFLVRKSVRRCARVSLCLRLCASGCAIKQTMQKCSQSLWTISILGMVVALSTPGKEILLDGAVQSAWRDYSSRPCLKVDKTGPHKNLFFLFPLNEKS